MPAPACRSEKFYKMSSSNTMTLIEKLTGRDNYSTWKFAVQNYFEHEELWACVEGTEKDVKLNTKAKSKLILLVDPINYVHIQEAKSAKQVWENLAKAFDDKGLTRRVGLLRDLITTRLESCQNVEDYVTKVMVTAHKLRNIGFHVDDQWLGTLLLAGLPDIYQPMIMAMESSGVLISADAVKTKLLQDIRTESTALLAKGNNKNKNQQETQRKGPRCYSCNRYGHISRYCKNSKKKENKSTDNTGYVAVFSATTCNKQGDWFIDSGASMHLTMHRDWLYDEISPPITSIKVADNKILLVKACGKLNLQVLDQKGRVQIIQVQNVLYVPELATNLLSVSQMIKNECHIQFDKRGCKIYNKNKEQVAEATLSNNMYQLKTLKPAAYMTEANKSDAYLWHQRMAHLNFDDLSKLSENAGVKIENKEKILCVPCSEGKQTRAPFPVDGSRAQSKLELIHSDVAGPIEVPSLGGARYFVTFIDDYTRKVYVYFMKNKSEVYEKFTQYKALAENQLNCKIKKFRTDNGTEYLSNEFKMLLQKSGILHQTSTPYTPQQNGLAERMNRTLLDRSRCMLVNAKLQKQYWAEAVATAAYITNRCPTRALQYATPEEKWTGKKPDISHMKIFGCEAMMHIPKEKTKKLDPKATKLIFIGYCENTKGYKLYDPKSRKVLISRDVIFMENTVKRNFALMPLSEDRNINESSTCEQSDEEKSSEDSFHSDEGSLYVPEEPLRPSDIQERVVTSKRKCRLAREGKSYLSALQENNKMTSISETYSEATSPRSLL